MVFTKEAQAIKDRLGGENVLEYNIYNDELNYFTLIPGLFLNNKACRDISNLVKEQKIDIVHVHNYFPLITPRVFKVAKQLGAKVVHTLHNFRIWCPDAILYRDGCGICELCIKHKFPFFSLIFRCYRRSFLASFIVATASFYYKIMKFFSYVDKYIVLSGSQKRKLEQFGVDPEKLFLKPNFIDIKVLPPADKKDFIFVGRLEESKGIMLLIESWKKLSSDFKLVVVGEGPLMAKIKRLNLSDNIKLLGKQGHEQTINLISRSKYMIHPSVIYETFGLTIVEAMRCATPVIGFNIGTRQELILDGHNGFLTSPGLLAETINKAQGYKEYSVMSNNAYRSSEQFNKTDIINKQIDLYNELIRA